MDATQNVNLDEGGEGAQTSAGLNSVNSTGLESVNSGVLPRAEEIPDVRLPILSIERLDPTAIDSLNALSDGEVYEEARKKLSCPRTWQQIVPRLPRQKRLETNSGKGQPLRHSCRDWNQLMPPEKRMNASCRLRGADLLH